VSKFQNYTAFELRQAIACAVGHLNARQVT